MTDRELDAAIAEKVMGWTIVDVPFVPAIVKLGPTVCLTDRAFKEWHKVYPHSKIPNMIPNYSTNRHAASLVLERIKEMGLGRECMQLLGVKVPNTKTYVDQLFEHVMATSRQFMEAAIAAVGDKK